MSCNWIKFHRYLWQYISKEPERQNILNKSPKLSKTSKLVGFFIIFVHIFIDILINYWTFIRLIHQSNIEITA